MVHDWCIDILAEFIEGFGLDARDSLATGKVALNFADGDIFHIELSETDSVDLLLCHDLLPAEQGEVLISAMKYNHYSKAQAYKGDAHFFNEQLVIKLTLERCDITLVGLEQALVSLRQARINIMVLN